MTAVTASEEAKPPDQITGYGTKRYRTYVLSVLTLIYVMNFVDRGLLAVVGPDLVPELGISDTQFGLLTGFGFALLYTIVGIPLARYADAAHRVWIMTVCVALWSLMTMLCGLATEVTIGSITIGAFWVLLMCRVGVGIGEAGCTPPANSLIADYFAPRDRAQALGVYSMGVTLGGMFANLIGGWVTDAFDWRTAFYVVGLPGLLIAVVFKLTATRLYRPEGQPIRRTGCAARGDPRTHDEARVLAHDSGGHHCRVLWLRHLLVPVHLSGSHA